MSLTPPLPQDAPALDLERFCFYPFMQLLLQPTGDISPCCWKQDLTLGNIRNQSLSELWNGPVIKALRTEFLSGNPVSCSSQMGNIGCHRHSRRNFHNIPPLHATMPGSPPRLDVRLNGRCNLQCIMCDVWKQPNGTYNESEFWSKGPSEIFPYLLEMDILGGEPFIQADTYRLVDQIHSVNPRCRFAFVTNAHYRFSPAIRTMLDKIELRWISISIDSVQPETYAEIRKGGQLARTLETLQEFVRYQAERVKQGRPFKLAVTMCVQQRNWHEIPDFIDFTSARELSYDLQFAFEPASQSLLSLSREARLEVLRHLVSFAHRYGADSIGPILSPLQESLARDA